jgi:hypothetical protein
MKKNVNAIPVINVAIKERKMIIVQSATRLITNFKMKNAITKLGELNS